MTIAVVLEDFETRIRELPEMEITDMSDWLWFIEVGTETLSLHVFACNVIRGYE